MTVLFNEIGLMCIVAAGFAIVARFFKQPPLLSYIVTGLILGPVGLRLLNNSELFESFRQIGIALLLFLVGLELDWHKSRLQLSSALLVSLLQTVASFLFGFYLALLAGQSLVTGLYLGISLAFASTVIAVKILSEDLDLNSLHGRLSVSLLLVQDIAAMLALTLLIGFSQPSTLSVFPIFFLIIIKVIAVLILTWIVAAYVLPQVFARIARSQELLFLASLAWCFIYSFILVYYDFPVEVGALLAGISLASLPYSSEVISRLRPLRGFFFIFLFVALGSSLVRPTQYYFILTLGLILFTSLLKPLVTYLMLSLRGFSQRTAFMTGLSQGQISEFSLLVVSGGVVYGHISGQLASAIILTAIGSSILSVLFLSNRTWMYNRFRTLLPNLSLSPHRIASELGQSNTASEPIVIFGYHRMGYHLLKKLLPLHKKVIIIDFNPDIVKRLQEQKIACFYGDIQDEELLESLKLPQAALVISTIPHREETLFLLDWLRGKQTKPLIIVTAHHLDDALHYYKLGADYVILPHLLSGEHVADIIADYEKEKTGQLLRHRAEEIKLLRTKNNVLYYD